VEHRLCARQLLGKQIQERAMMRWTVWISSLAVALVIWGGGASSVSRSAADTLTIGAYSVVRDVLHEAILPRFARHWELKTGRKVRFEESYSGSGAQARAIASGFDADVAILSLEGDIDKLVKAGLVRKDWKAGPHRGMITRSLVVIGYRPGNPNQIRDWEDLTKPGIGVVYPDPKTSGGARWNINAIYGVGLLRSSRSVPDREAARDLLARVQGNVITMDASGRQSMATFERGTGDAIVTYENELLLQGKLEGRVPPYAIPPSTLLIEGPAAVVDAYVNRHGNRELAEAFLDYLRSEEGQSILTEYGFRPLDPTLDTNPDREPLPQGLFTMNDLGGWDKNKKEVYETGGVWDSLFTGWPKSGGRR
jgi:sulfate/thiosulfate transport system substrate-binding protein